MSNDYPPVAVAEVFTPGRSPIFTYNPRDERNLEGSIRRYTETTGSAVVISGPTKSGKSVLVDRVLPESVAVWVNGSNLRSLDDLWDSVIEFLGLYSDLTVQVQHGEVASGGGGASAGMPGLLNVSSQIGASSTRVETRTAAVHRSRSTVARNALRDVSLPVVIDDFHYVAKDLQVELTRAIKALVPQVPIVMIAVPQDAFDAVRAETDMLGRVVQIAIEPWSEDELMVIAEQGFKTLRLEDANGLVAKEFAQHSLGAPYLMQQLCLEFCLASGVERRQDDLLEVSLPADLLGFYRSVASRAVPGVFNALKAGPKTKGQPRKARIHNNGLVTDIYGAILYGISQMGPVRSISTQTLVRKIGEFFTEPPTSQNVAFALGQMSTIAHNNRRGSDAVLDFKDDTIYIGDPFLSFYLRFGEWELPKAPEDAV